MRLMGRRLAVYKRSDTWPFADSFHWLHHSAIPQDIEDVLARAGRIHQELQGRDQETFCCSIPTRADAGWVFRRLTSPPTAQLLMYELTLSVRPGWCAELGAAFGVTSMAIAAALRRNGTGEFDGIEYEPWKADIANRLVNDQRFRIHAGTIEDQFPRLAAHRGTVDLCYVDALHTFDDMTAYHRLVSEAVTDGAIVVYDDIDFDAGTERFWAQLLEKPNVTDAVLLDGRWGIVRYGST
jgi:predicted O-methyltransferase YrrM